MHLLTIDFHGHVSFEGCIYDGKKETPNNQSKMDVWWFTTISCVKIWFMIQLKESLKNWCFSFQIYVRICMFLYKERERERKKKRNHPDLCNSISKLKNIPNQMCWDFLITKQVCSRILQTTTMKLTFLWRMGRDLNSGMFLLPKPLEVFKHFSQRWPAIFGLENPEQMAIKIAALRPTLWGKILSGPMKGRIFGRQPAKVSLKKTALVLVGIWIIWAKNMYLLPSI